MFVLFNINQMSHDVTLLQVHRTFKISNRDHFIVHFTASVCTAMLLNLMHSISSAIKSIKPENALLYPSLLLFLSY